MLWLPVALGPGHRGLLRAADRTHEIKGIEHELISAAFIRRRLQPTDDGHTLGIEGPELAIDVGRLTLGGRTRAQSCAGNDATSQVL